MDQAHGRHVTREVYPFEISPEQAAFPYAVQAALIVRTTHNLKSQHISQDIEMVLTSRPACQMSGKDHIGVSRRRHWSIESRLHYVRDVTLGEDRSTVRTGQAPANMAALRNLVIGICALEGIGHHQTHSSLPSLRRKANNDRQVLLELVSRPLAKAA